MNENCDDDYMHDWCMISKRDTVIMIRKMDIVDAAKRLATIAHQNQFRRDGKTPYITHPEAVANAMVTPEEKAIAWLHDILEDTEYTVSHILFFGIPKDIIRDIEALTKTKRITYEEYLANLLNHPRARRVKIADMLHNYNDTPTTYQRIKYSNGISFLRGEISSEQLKANMKLKIEVKISL